MARIVMKFGGTSVADVERIKNVAAHVKREVDAGNQVAVVVSAMSGKTNELVGWVNEAARLHDAREYDTVVASGEQVTVGLLSIALQEMGVAARSWLGWQVPIRTNGAHSTARITEIDAELLDSTLSPSADLLADIDDPVGTAQRHEAVTRKWEALDVDRRRLLVDELVTVTIEPVRPGHVVFDPDLIRIEPRRG